MKNEPLYRKWWAWIGLLLIAAIIINNNQEQIIPASLDYEDLLPSYESDEAVALCCNDQTNQHAEISTLSDDNFLRVGIDISPGEYFVKAHENTHGYVMLARDTSGSVDAVITNKNFRTHSFITVHEGEYLTVERATLMEAEQAVVPTFTNGVLGDGVYRVGIDIPPGIYRVVPTSNVAGYYQIATDSRGTASNILSNANFSEEISITLAEGQYLTLTRAQIFE